MNRKSHKRVHVMVMGTSDVLKVVFQVFQVLPWISSRHFYFLELKSCYWLHCIHTTIFKSLKWLLNCLNHWFEPISESEVKWSEVENLWQWWRKKKKGESWSYLQLNDNDFTLVLRLSALITNSERPSIYVVLKISVNCVVLEHVE